MAVAPYLLNRAHRTDATEPAASQLRERLVSGSC